MPSSIHQDQTRHVIPRLQGVARLVYLDIVEGRVRRVEGPLRVAVDEEADLPAGRIPLVHRKLVHDGLTQRVLRRGLFEGGEGDRLAYGTDHDARGAALDENGRLLRVADPRRQQGPIPARGRRERIGTVEPLPLRPPLALSGGHVRLYRPRTRTSRRGTP